MLSHSSTYFSILPYSDRAALLVLCHPLPLLRETIVNTSRTYGTDENLPGIY